MTSAILSFLLFLSLSLSSLADFADNNPTLDISPDALEWIGATQTCIHEGNEKRCFYTYIPDCAGDNVPLVFDIHGYGSSPYLSSLYTSWVQKAEENCFVLVLPLGHADSKIDVTTCWGLPGGLTDVGSGTEALPCCCSLEGKPTFTNDATFLRNVAAVVVEEVPEETSNKVTINTKRIYMAGHSNGCIASIAMATLNSDLVAAVGCHAGAAMAPFPNSYIPTPMMRIHGTADVVVPYNGSSIFLNATSTYSLFADANGCTENEETRKIDESTNSYTNFTSTSCTNNSTVVLLAIDGVGHNPYKGFEAIAPIEEGTVPTNFDTTQLAWEFISSYSSAVAPELSYDGEITKSPTSSGQITKSSTSSSPHFRRASTASSSLMLILSLLVLF